MIPIAIHPGSSEERHLLDLFGQLGEQDRVILLTFAQFLAARTTNADTRPTLVAPEPPRDFPRPPEETVVGAIKRLSQSYFMLDRRDMLNETSSLMAAHVLQGCPTEEVIESLERVFQSHYEKYLETWRK